MKLRVLDHLGSTGRLSQSTSSKARLVAGLGVIVASIGLAGCGPHRVKADFTAYENSYAVTSNREVLLNLARLEQHDPTYFFKLGQISSSYRMSASLPMSGMYIPQGTTPGGGNASGGGSPSLIYENDPSFSFIPVNDETNARLLMNPVSEDLFYNLYQQGWRVDQLFRLMVDRIEVTLPPKPGETGCQVEIIRNVPPPAYYGPDFKQSQLLLTRYVTFLRVSAVVYALQKHGLLLLQGTPAFQSLDNNSWLNDDSATSGSAASSPKTSAAPTAKDFDDAAAKNPPQVWELQKDNKWHLGQKVLVPRFQLISTVPDTGSAPEKTYGDNVSAIENLLRNDAFRDDPSLSVLENAPELTDILEILYSGFAIGGSTTDQDPARGPCPAAGSGSVSSHLVMRSLIGLMAAAGQEQAFFDELAKDQGGRGPAVAVAKDDLVQNIHIGLLKAQNLTSANDKQAYLALLAGEAKQASTGGIYFHDLIPSIENIPVLRLTWSAETRPPKAHAADPKEIGMGLNYKGREYEVADGDFANIDESKYARENESWNRDMFRLICQLSSQVTVDISKFPLPEILQLRTE